MDRINKQREGWIDVARGIAIVLIVLGHVIHIVERELSVVLPGFDVLDRVLYSFHVPVFFFLAGMFLFSSSSDLGVCGLIWKRAKRLLYPYLLWSVLQTTLEVASASGGRERLAGELLQILYFPQAHFWFLYVLFFCGAIGIALRGVLGTKRATVWVLLGLSLIWYALHPILPGGPIKDLGVYLPYFALGAWGRMMNDESTAAKAMEGRRGTMNERCSWLSAYALLGLFLCSILLAVSKDLETNVLLRLPIGLLGVGAVLMSSYVICASRRLRGLAYIGRRSMAIYLIHVLAIHALFICLPDFAYLPSMCLAMVAGVGLPLIFAEVCGRLHIAGLFGLR